MMKQNGIRNLILAMLVAAALAAPALAEGPAAGALFTATNATDGNEVWMYDRAADGTLTFRAAFETGGTGTGGGLGNQGGLIFSEGLRFLFVVNAGSDEITSFEVRRNRLELVDRVSSGGERPVSLTIDRQTLYVLNAGGIDGGTDNITGFTVGDDGTLTPIANSTQPLSAASTSPAQVSFTPDGRQLVVTERATNIIDIYAVDDDGVAGAPTSLPSAGTTPFGFDFSKRGLIFVSEANGGTESASYVSVYKLDCDGNLTTIAARVRTEETAACWVVVTDNGRFAYTTNTMSGTISGFTIAADGNITLLESDGQSGQTGDGSGPIDLALDRLSLHLYSLNGGDGSISAFRVASDGELIVLADGGITGLPAGANGLAVR